MRLKLLPRRANEDDMTPCTAVTVVSPHSVMSFEGGAHEATATGVATFSPSDSTTFSAHVSYFGRLLDSSRQRAV
jgi:hypothetical protein